MYQKKKITLYFILESKLYIAGLKNTSNTQTLAVQINWKLTEQLTIRYQTSNASLNAILTTSNTQCMISLNYRLFSNTNRNQC